MVTAPFITMEPVRVLMITLAAGALVSSWISSTSARKLTRALGSTGARKRTRRPSMAFAVPLPSLALMASATRRAVWKSAALRPEVDGVTQRKRRGHCALDLCARRNAARAQVVDLHLAATARSAGATHQHVALGQRIDLAIHTLQWRGDQGAAAQGLGIAHGRHGDIDHLPGLGEGGQVGGDQHGRHVLHLDLAVSGQRHAQLLQVVGHALGGVGHLVGLIARAVQPHHQPETGELVGAHALHRRHFLDADRMGFQRPAQPYRAHHQQGAAHHHAPHAASSSARADRTGGG